MQATTQNNLRSVDEVPLPYRTVFGEFPCFNVVQSSVLDEALKTDNSMVVSAPTGSGKTAIFELAIIRHLMNVKESLDPINNRIIYISPIKALCKERFTDWYKKFVEFGINCISTTSDSDEVEIKNVLHYNLIISTPEKWDVMTRRWRADDRLVGSVRLFLIDEVHLLNGSRGSTLEVIVSRMKTATESLKYKYSCGSIRFVALSATIPNIEDIAEWIGPAGTAKSFKFSEDVRPVKLNKVVLGYPFNSQSQSVFKFDMSLSYKISGLISKYSEGKPTLIFCNTRKSVEMTANHLVSTLQIYLSSPQKEVLQNISQELGDSKLNQCVVHGIAIHHAGMVPENRHIIEESFRKGLIPVLVTTSTLAMGVNLPAHLVIVKGTKCFSDGGYKDYDEISIFQMIGRAGRSQFDSSATALILTSNQDRLKYEQMLGCEQIIESNLHKHLKEHLNAEVVLRTITDLDVAMRWLSSTFLYVRARRSPEKYKLPRGLSKDKIDKKLLEMCQAELNRLVQAGMIKMNEAIEVSPTVIGEIMAKYYVAFETMKLFTEMSGAEIMIQLLAIISKCYEFSEIYLRNNDKRCLNLLNRNTTKESNRFPLSGRIKTVEMKVNVLIQAVLGNLEIPDQSVLCDSVKIMRCCERLSKCLIEFVETKEKSYSALLNAIILAKCFRVKLWENSPYVSKQLTGVGVVNSHLLVKSGLTTFKDIAKANPRHIEMVVNRKAPFGNTLIDEATRLPQYDLDLTKIGDLVEVKLRLLNFTNIQEKCTIDRDSMMTLLVGNSNNDILLYEKYSHAYMFECPEVKCSINFVNSNFEFIKASFISENWVGIDCYKCLEFGGNKVVPTLEEKSKKSNQTFMDMYMSTVKKAAMPKKKIENNRKLKILSSSKITEKHVKKAEKLNTKQEVNDNNLGVKILNQEQNNILFNIPDNSVKIMENRTTKQENANNSDYVYGTETNINKIFNTESSIPLVNMSMVKKPVLSGNNCCESSSGRPMRCDSMDDAELEFSKSQFDKLDELMWSTCSASNPSNESAEINANENRVIETEMQHPDSTAEQNGFYSRDVCSPFPKKQRKMEDSASSYPSDAFGQKSIKWRSPLIQSPVGKYSPKICRSFDFNGQTGNQDVVFRERYLNTECCHQENSSFAKHSTSDIPQKQKNMEEYSKRAIKKKSNNQFPLSDQDAMNLINESFKRKEKEEEDVLDHEFSGLSNTSYESTSRYYTMLVSSDRKAAKDNLGFERPPIKAPTVPKSNEKSEVFHQSPDIFSERDLLPLPKVHVASPKLMLSQSQTRHQNHGKNFSVSRQYNYNEKDSDNTKFTTEPVLINPSQDIADKRFNGNYHPNMLCKPTTGRCSSLNNNKLAWYSQQYPCQHNQYLCEEQPPIQPNFIGHHFSRTPNNFPPHPFSSTYSRTCCTKPCYNHYMEGEEQYPCWSHHMRTPQIERRFPCHQGFNDICEDYVDDCLRQLDEQPLSHITNSRHVNLSGEMRRIQEPFLSQPALSREDTYGKENINSHYYTSAHCGSENPYEESKQGLQGFQQTTQILAQKPQYSEGKIVQVFGHTPKSKLPVRRNNNRFSSKLNAAATLRNTMNNFQSFEDRLNDYIEPQDVVCPSVVHVRHQPFEQSRDYRNPRQSQETDFPRETFFLANNK
ncbi:probable ATP-dependent DNA helicase HFM1 [Euwallacea fornicatus]|uniref:probable ATP-dependent DNA helicase HFM1 n=1 Tax=Euwallacea fornicatus TaxID=995702 RepID=UPI00338E0085